MKNLMRVVLIAVMMGVAACEGPEGLPGPEGPPGKDGGITEWHYVDFEVDLNGWKLAGNGDEIGSYYYVVFDAPEITQDIYEDGWILCNYRYIDDTGTEVQAPLPYTEYFIDENSFAMYFSYNTTPGTIEFRVTFSDFYTGEKGPPEHCWFRMTLIY